MVQKKDAQYEAIKEAVRAELGIEEDTYTLDREAYNEVINAGKAEGNE
jgi:hypothetical protein